MSLMPLLMGRNNYGAAHHIYITQRAYCGQTSEECCIHGTAVRGIIGRKVLHLEHRSNNNSELPGRLKGSLQDPRNPFLPGKVEGIPWEDPLKDSSS